MQKSRLTEEQIIGMINEQDSGMTTGEVCRKHGISLGTFYKYKSKYGGMEVSDVAKLRAMEEGDRQAQAAVGRRHAGQCRPEGSSGKELTTPNERREAARRAMRDHDISQRRACRLIPPFV